MRRGALEALSEAGEGVSVGERVEFGAAEGALRGHPRWFVATCALAGNVIGGVPQDTVGLAQLLIGEESRLAVAHRDHQPVADVAVVMEEEQPGVAGFRVSVDVDVVVQGLATARQLAHERQVTPEQAVHPLAAVGEVGSQPRRQQQVGLAGLDDHAR